MTENEAPMSEEESLKPIVETSVTVDGALQTRLTKRLRVMGLVGMIVGAILLLGYIVCSTLFETLAEDGGMVEPWLNTLFQCALWGGAFLFVAGLILFFSMRASVKNIKTVYRNTYRFYERFVCIQTERQGEEISTLKLYYADLMKVQETGEFFLLYNSASSCFAVEKAKLSPTELAALRGCLPVKPRRG